MTSRLFTSWKRFLIALASVCLVFVIFGFIPQGRLFVEDSDRRVFDRIIRSGGGTPEREDFVLLGIDEASLSLSNLSSEEIEASKTLKMMGARFPWDRRVWAEAIDKLCEAGAKLVVLDLIFAEPSTSEQDAALAAAIARYPEKVILSSAFSPLGQQQDGHMVFTLTEPYVEFLESDPEPRIGFVNLWPNQRDGATRTFRYRSSLGRENQRELIGEMEFLSLAGQIMDAYGISVPQADQELRYTSKSDTLGTEIYKPRSLYEIFVDAFWQTNYAEGEFFRDKVVVIGPVAERFQDIHETPVGTITGPQIHMQAAAGGIAGAYVYHVGHPALVISLMGLIAAAMVGGIEKPRWSALAILLLVSGFVILVWVLGKTQSVMIPLTGGVIAVLVGWVSAMVYQLIIERMEKDRLRGTFRRFVSRDVADRLVDKPEQWQAIAEGRKRRVVVLFSDVRGFSTRAEQTEPSELVAQLNEYLAEMVAVVFKHGGTLDKFIGDAVMVQWGSLDENESGHQDSDHCRTALAAARDMQTELALLNQRWAREGRKPFEIGIGIHLGEVVAAELGSPQRIEFGVIGDAVNLASRLEGLTKPFGCDIVFSDSVYHAAKPHGAIELGAVVVVGRTTATELYAFGDECKIKAALDGMDRDENGAIVMKSK